MDGGGARCQKKLAGTLGSDSVWSKYAIEIFLRWFLFHPFGLRTWEYLGGSPTPEGGYCFVGCIENTNPVVNHLATGLLFILQVIVTY